MSIIELTDSQKKVFQALVDLYRESESAVKGESIAEMVERNLGTVRNQMQSLKALQLAEGVPGPKEDTNRPRPPTARSTSRRWTNPHPSRSPAITSISRT